MNEKSYSVLKKSYITVGVIILAASLLMMGFFAVILTVLVKSFADSDPQSGISEKLRILRVAVPVLIAFIALISGLSLFRAYKIRLKLMRETAFVECTVKDFLITSRRKQHGRKYIISPILEDTKTGELYCAFEYDNMSFYTATYTRNANSLRSAVLRRSDGSSAALGDTVRVYIKKFVDRNAEINGDMYTINGKRHRFLHADDSIGIEVLNRLRFFKGIMDIERD